MSASSAPAGATSSSTGSPDAVRRCPARPRPAMQGIGTVGSFSSRSGSLSCSAGLASGARSRSLTQAAGRGRTAQSAAAAPFVSGSDGATGEDGSSTEFVAETLLPTTSGKYRVRAYRHRPPNGGCTTEPLAIIYGAVEGLAEVPMRVHDACFTSEVLGSMKCDCAGQLAVALQFIREHGPGLVVYLHQEGRGIGLANKIAAYHLQESGLDTVDANRALGLPDDTREYSAVAHILRDLRVQSVRVLTNNPRKTDQLTGLGVRVEGRIACRVVEPFEASKGYLKTKQLRMRHMLPGLDAVAMATDAAADEVESEQQLDGAWCYVSGDEHV